MNQFYQAGVAGAERVFEFLDADVTIADKPGAVHLERFDGPIAFEGVRFAYRETEVLKGIDAVIPRGRTVALVGESGAGKSTMATLLPRFYDVTGGRITVNGHDIRDISVASLRSMMALVTQDVFLFNDTVRSNIAYGHKELMNEDRVVAAAKAAYAHDFIMAMPDGYDTLVGERGIKLSGGQKQRLAIARALLKDAPILILDEATSSLDSEGEAEVQKALDELMKNRTTLVIAHRLSTIRNAGEILVLKDGTVIERGGHEELLALGSEYAKLHRLQFRDG
jgi:subfamily B ATP-binding cassette protein MsbA